MQFYGLFIGVDRYASPLIGDLTCAARDARTLFALFADTFGGAACQLLTDHAATRTAITTALETLTHTDQDDLVFIYFSGHGSDTHDVVTHDADPVLLSSTALPLEELVQLFSRIGAKNVILCLDCCFAGGAGAKVFHSPIATRDPASTEAILQKIGGTGRVIFTAANAEQEAIEDRRKGHGIFTYYLIQSLMGAPEVVDSGAVPFLALANFVTRAVEAAAAVFRHAQQPGLRGTLDGDIRLPILVPGSTFHALFPAAPTSAITSELNSLAGHGFTTSLIDAIAGMIPSLNDLQQDAVNQMGLFAGDHQVVSAPTSSGKTMIGELAALKAHLRGERSYMLLPLRALVNDKYEDLQQKYRALGVRIIRATGEIADDNDALIRGKFDIALLTYERFAGLAIAAPFVLRNVGLVVVDEVQMITDEGRGANLEFLLTFLRAQRAQGIEPQLVALSAVIGDTNGFERWLGARLLKSTQRPVPLQEGTLNLAGAYRHLDVDGSEKRTNNYVTPEYRKGSSQDVIIPLVRQLVKAGEKVIVFREIKVVVRATAMYLANSLGLPPATNVLDALPEGDMSSASGALRNCLQGGVAFHNADLDRLEREAIERSFRDPNGEVKVLVATTTLAMGVNTPAWSVVIEGLDHPGNVPYTVAEYKNMVGRAGRLGWTPTGKAFLIAASPGDEERLWRSYVLGRPEALRSRFGELNILSAVCRVLATAAAARLPSLAEDEIVDFLRSTFAAFQSGSIWSSDDIQRALRRLTEAGLVEEVDSRLRLTSLGAVAGGLGITVESVVRVARSLRGVALSELRAATLIAATQITEELDQVYLPMHRTSTKERQRWQSVPTSQGLPRSVINAITSGATDPEITARCKRLAAALMWIEGVELGPLEQSLLQHVPEDSAAGAIRAVADRTRDLLTPVSRIAEVLHPGEASDAQAELVDSLYVQLEIGIPTDIVWLAARVKRRLSRAEYLSLRRAGFASASKLLTASPDALASVITNVVAQGLVREAAESEIASTDNSPLPMPTPPSTPT